MFPIPRSVFLTRGVERQARVIRQADFHHTAPQALARPPPPALASRPSSRPVTTTAPEPGRPEFASTPDLNRNEGLCGRGLLRRRAWTIQPVSARTP